MSSDSAQSSDGDQSSGSVQGVELTVITTCLNEEDNIDAFTTRTLATFDAMGVTAELVIVDDGSSDSTWDCIQKWSRNTHRVRGIRHDSNRGIEAGWNSGLSAASGRLVCLIDSDMQNAPEDVARLYTAHESRTVDIVQAARRPQNPPMTRYALSRGLNLLLNVAFGMRLIDNKSGFILCRKEILERTMVHRFAYRYFQCFIATSAHSKGFSFHQIESVFHPRAGGKSFLADIPFQVIAVTFLELIKARIEFRTSHAVPRPTFEAHHPENHTCRQSSDDMPQTVASGVR